MLQNIKLRDLLFGWYYLWYQGAKKISKAFALPVWLGLIMVALIFMVFVLGLEYLSSILEK